MANPHPFFVLQEIGLPEKAVSLYMTLLNKSRMTIAELARESGIKRATCYEYVDQLLKRGFAIRVPIGKRMFYSPVEPNRILADYKKKVALLEHSSEEMTDLYENAISKPKISYVEGKSAIKGIYEDLFKKAGEIISIFSADSFFEYFSEADYDEYDKLAAKHSLKSKDLFVRGRNVKKIKEIRARNGGEKLDRLLPKDFTCNVHLLIYTDKVALISLRDQSALVIEDRNIAGLLKKMHELIWKSV